MSYFEIFVLGWNLNGFVFLVNLLLAFLTVKANDPISLHKQSEVLKELKEEFDILYPNRKYEVMISYILPFTAFFRTSFRFIEMSMFFKANQDTKMYDFMVYKYTEDINKQKR
ncbi:MAG TPA: hypothetical protein EYG97_04295 [Arcobacter sp.]|nr:hypothetical protein [Arcobacter sp.]HIP56225.1 hypothetical protein [Arcobacter sp.]